MAHPQRQLVAGFFSRSFSNMDRHPIVTYRQYNPRKNSCLHPTPRSYIFRKLNMYPDAFDNQADLLKVLAHPSRLEILHCLEHGEMTVTDLYEMLDLPQSQVSQHLMKLRRAHIVSAHRVGKQIHYSAAPSLYQKLHQTLQHISQTCSRSQRRTSHMVLDPVCHMRVNPSTTPFSAKYQQHTYHFCASKCYRKFTTSPEKYA